MTRRSRTGSEHREEFRPDFHDRLARNWPEPREQLHAGGWEATRSLVEKLQIGEGSEVLDMYSGEGGTAVWIAGSLGARVHGIDILNPAVQVARKRAAFEGVSARCSFYWGNIFSLPFANGVFDVVYGQDPDGLAHRERVVAFKECFRVLRPNGMFGFQHWIPGIDAPKDLVRTFDLANVEAGYPSHGEVHADAYIAAMQSAGFRELRTIDMSDTYKSHMLAIQSRVRQRGETVDKWTETWLQLSEVHPFGIMALARRR